jgi:hypothetical protein
MFGAALHRSLLARPADNAGLSWRPQGKPEKVKVHDFLDPEKGKAIPYGVYDLARNLGWVKISTLEEALVPSRQDQRNWGARTL